METLQYIVLLIGAFGAGLVGGGLIVKTRSVSLGIGTTLVLVALLNHLHWLLP